MYKYRLHTHAGMLALLAFHLGGCATSPPPDAGKTASAAAVVSASEGATSRALPADAPELIRLKVDSTLPVAGTGRDDGTLLAGALHLGIDADLLSYSASYALESGDVFAADRPVGATRASPTHFGGQRIGQKVSLTLPELGGAPLSLGITSEIRNTWLVSGYAQSQQQRADLSWAPGPANVDVRWTAGGMPFDATTALRCDVLGTLHWPTHEGLNHSEGITLSGGDCAVSAADTPYTGIETQTWGLGYVWSAPSRESRAELSVIEPVWAEDSPYRNVAPGYMLGLSHQRDFGPLSARTQLAWRQPSSWERALAVDTGGDFGAADGSWASNTSLTWRLAEASLSANWAQGADRLWFTPLAGRRSDNFGLALNMSRWIAGFMPESAPRFGMNWNWSRVRMPDDEISGDRSLNVNLALMF